MPEASPKITGIIVCSRGGYTRKSCESCGASDKASTPRRLCDGLVTRQGRQAICSRRCCPKCSTRHPLLGDLCPSCERRFQAKEKAAGRVSIDTGGTD